METDNKSGGKMRINKQRLGRGWLKNKEQQQITKKQQR
jgi:hypothetical protein